MPRVRAAGRVKLSTANTLPLIEMSIFVTPSTPGVTSSAGVVKRRRCRDL